MKRLRLAVAAAGRTATSAATALLVFGCLMNGMGGGCGRDRGKKELGSSHGPGPLRGGNDGRRGAPEARRPRPSLATLPTGQVYVYESNGTSAAAMTEAEARARGLLVVDLGDGWAPFIFQDGGGPARAADDAPPAAAAADGGATGHAEVSKPNGYRQTFIDLANDRISAEGRPIDPASGEHNFLEPFGIPPSLSVFRARAERDGSADVRSCEAKVDLVGLRAFTGNLGYSDRERAKREFTEAVRDGEWLSAEIARREAATAAAAGTAVVAHDAVAPTAVPVATGGAPVTRVTAGGAGASALPVPTATWKTGDRTAALLALRRDANPKVKARAERAVRGQERLRAVRAAQARLVCEGLLSDRSRFTPGMFDLPTHEALAAWERKNDIFGWGFLGGETLAALQRSALDLDFETFRRIVAERVADAAGIVEDGSIAKWKVPPTYVVPTVTAGWAGGDGGASAVSAPGVDGGAPAGERRPVPNLIEDHVAALLASLQVTNPETMLDFLRQHSAAGWSTLRVGIKAPPLPPYYTPRMDLSVEIDRGDVWYDFPFDGRGKAVEQPRERFPHVTLYVQWQGQKVPLCSWRTTIGSWRSEMNANGKVYYKYKNSDIGPRFWKDIVAGPVWIPPDGTPAKDLLTRKVLDLNKGPEVVVNTDVMGPGFQSAYGLVMAIHINRGGFDNQIRTHGSVDYTSIARRFSHGCHRLVNNRAVRLFDFILRRQPFQRIGSIPLSIKRTLVVDQQQYAFELKTRGYYYRLEKPIPVMVTEGRVMGTVKAPVTAYVRKAGVDYSDVETRAETRPPEPLAVPDSAASIQVPPAEEAPAAIDP